jgi:predicted TIM-barrel fold metal-dependent hydrolase
LVVPIDQQPVQSYLSFRCDCVFDAGAHGIRVDDERRHFGPIPNLRVVYLEAGSLWIHFILERLHHRYQHSGKNLANVVSRTAPVQKLPPMEYIKRANLYFSAEVEDVLLPQVLELVGDGQIMFGSDMPHGDRERFAAEMLQKKADIGDAAKAKILGSNPARFYRLPGFS